MKALERDMRAVLQRDLPFSYTVKGYSPHLVTFLLHEMQSCGVAQDDALAGSAISPADLRDKACRFSVLQILQVVVNSLRLTPDIAFRVGGHFHVVACGIYGYAMLSSPDRLHLINAVTRYAHLVDPLTKVSYLRLPGQSMWQFEPHLCDDPAHPLYRFAIELKLASCLRIGRDLYGPQFRLAGVRLRYRAPAQAAAYARHLQCPVEFGHDANQLFFNDAYAVLQGLACPDPITHALAIELCEQEASRVAPVPSLAGRIATLVRDGTHGFAGIEKVAADVLLHPRTLRRRLKAEGTSFSDIVNQQRLDMARQYLLRNEMTNDQIASRLGYSDASSFRKAFVAWSGHTPSRFRQLHGGAARAVTQSSPTWPDCAGGKAGSGPIKRRAGSCDGR